MEPKSPEQLPTPIEYTPNPLPVEQLPASPERAEPTPERSQEQRQSTMPAAPAPVTSVQLPTPVPVSPAADDTPAAQSSNPSAAADEDLIEKEWVDKAKKIITDTKDDPHAREREVGKLQADYLKKRYGKELGNQT